MEIKEVAQKLCAKYGTHDPFEIVRDMGFVVIFAPLVEMRGFQQRIKRRNVIYVNSELDEQQQRLVCAHELGHHLLHRGMNRVFMDKSTRMMPGKYEKEAHRFSADLLFGDEELQPFLDRPIEDAAAYMGVDVELARYRLANTEPMIWERFE